MDNEITNNTLYEVQVNVLNTELGNKDLTTLGEEIEAYDNLAGKCFEEVCKRYWYIKNVVFRDDSKGWREWRDKQGRSKRYINQCIKFYQDHLDSKSGNSSSHFELGYKKNDLLSSIVEESDRDAVVNNIHEINGVEKTVDSMTVKELEAVIKQQKEKIKEQETTIKDSEKKSQEEKNNAKDEGFKEGFKEGKQAKIDEEKSTIDKYYRERYNNEVASKTSKIRQEYQKRLDELGSELDSTIEELDHYKDVLYKDKEVNREYQRLEEQSKKLKRKIDELEQWGTLEANLDLAIAQATALITGDIGTNENDNEALILSISRTVNRLRKITKLLEDNFDIIGETTIYKEDGIEIIDVEGI